MSLRSDYPFPPRNLGLSYFEVTVKEAPKSEPDDPQESDQTEKKLPTISIDLCGEYSDQFEAHPGWNVWTIGYGGDHGGIFEHSGSPKYETNRTFGFGHTVGCGVDYAAGKYVFTLDGEVVCMSASNLVVDSFRKNDKDVLTMVNAVQNTHKFIYRKLYPCIGHSDGAASVKVNFGASPFVWEGTPELYQPGEEVVPPPKLRRQGTDLGRSRSQKRR